MSTQEPPTAATPQDSPHRTLYQSYITYCNAHNFRAMEQFYTSPININDEPWSPTKVTAQFAPLVEAFPDWHWEIRHFGVDGDCLYLHFRVEGTHRGTFRGVEATGRRVATTQFTIYRVVDGRFTDVWDMTDIESLVKQIS